MIDLDAVTVVDEDDRLVNDIWVAELFAAVPDTLLRGLIGPPWPVTVTADASIRETARKLADSRRLSVVALDDHDQPVWRIMADDILGRGARRPPPLSVSRPGCGSRSAAVAISTDARGCV